MKKFLRNYWIVITIFLLGLSISWPLFRSGYFSHQDDLQIIRLVEMRKCFSDLQIPCRWVPDMGWGNGIPLFNFYGVFTYYLGGIISFITGFLVASKILFFVCLIAGSFGIYLLVKDLWGKYAGLTSAVLYMFAPYKALDIYVRGALAESMALTLIPFVLYFGYKKNFKLFTVTLFFFFITHNIMTIIFLPVIFLWILYWHDLRSAVKTFVIALGLSAFFILPAFLEKDLVQTESLTRFELDYRANFVSIKQLFIDRVWGYGTSIPGPEGGMNFSIGWPHWWLVLFSAVAVFYLKAKKSIQLTTFCLLLFLFSIFMTHNKSTFVWETFSILTYFQFPWRFLSLSILTASILGGIVVSIIKDKWQIYLTILIVVFAVLANWSYFKPREFYDINESEKLSGELWEIQKKGALLDYLPKTALEPRESAQMEPLVITGKVDNSLFKNFSNNWKYKVNVVEDAKIEIPIYYFPNWVVKVNGEVYPSNHDNLLGRISFNLPKGEYTVIGQFKNTPLRSFANILSLLSLIYFITKWKKHIN